MEKLNIFSSNHTIELAKKVIETININRSDGSLLSSMQTIQLGDCRIEYFSNKEITCEYESSIRHKPVYIFGDTGTENIMELLLMLDAAKRASASEIHVVLPCYGYARQDKKEGKQKRGPIGAKLVADLLSVAAGVNFAGLITIDLHADAIEGFFDVPVNHISGTTIFKEELRKMIALDSSSYVIASPDAGGKQRATRMAKKLGLEMVGMDKTRTKPGEVASISLVGDVVGKRIVICDDIVDSGGTLIKAAEYLIEEKQAQSVQAVCTHPILSGTAVDKIFQSKYLEAIWVADTIPLTIRAQHCPKIHVVSACDILAKIIGRIYTHESMNTVNS